VSEWFTGQVAHSKEFRDVKRSNGCLQIRMVSPVEFHARVHDSGIQMNPLLRSRHVQYMRHTEHTVQRF